MVVFLRVPRCHRLSHGRRRGLGDHLWMPGRLEGQRDRNHFRRHGHERSGSLREQASRHDGKNGRQFDRKRDRQ